MSVEWLCARCANKTGKTPEPDPVILRLCTECQVENWVRPYGHAGEDITASDAEVTAAFEKAKTEAEARRAMTEQVIENRKEKNLEEFAEAAKAISKEVEIVEVLTPENKTAEHDPYAEMTKEQLMEELKKRG